MSSIITCATKRWTRCIVERKKTQTNLHLSSSVNMKWLRKEQRLLCEIFVCVIFANWSGNLNGYSFGFGVVRSHAVLAFEWVPYDHKDSTEKVIHVDMTGRNVS